MCKAKKQADQLLKQAETLIWLEIQKRVIKILTNPKKSGVTFIAAMGTYFFIDKERNVIDPRAWMEPVNVLFEEYDETFKLSGIGWRWDLDQESGKVIKSTDW